MDRGVIYLLTGPSHGVRMVVSLWSLRAHFAGPITVYTTHPDSHEIGRQCAVDPRLKVEHRTCELISTRKNASFLTKVSLLPKAPYTTNLYLDADTIPAGDVSQLWEEAEQHEFCATRFSDWISTGRKMRKRIEQWRDFEQDRYDLAWLEQLVDAALQPHPAVNGGIFAFQPTAKLLKPWFELAMTGKNHFICDEVALQLLLHHYPHGLVDCRFNCSPTFGKSCHDVRIWHFHGEKHIKRDNYRALWWPIYQECVINNVANINDWGPASDRRLAGYLRSLQKAAS